MQLRLTPDLGPATFTGEVRIEATAHEAVARSPCTAPN